MMVERGNGVISPMSLGALVISAAIFIRLAVSLHPYSGQNKTIHYYLKLCMNVLNLVSCKPDVVCGELELKTGYTYIISPKWLQDFVNLCIRHIIICK